MSTYELDDELVRQYVEGLTPVEERHALRHALADQLPARVPTKVGAVVRTEMPVRGPSEFIRWAPDTRTHSPWIQAADHEHPYRTDEIGRITEVLSEGVDL
jgi:hypothetical protein